MVEVVSQSRYLAFDLGYLILVVVKLLRLLIPQTFKLLFFFAPLLYDAINFSFNIFSIFLIPFTLLLIISLHLLALILQVRQHHQLGLRDLLEMADFDFKFVNVFFLLAEVGHLLSLQVLAVTLLDLAEIERNFVLVVAAEVDGIGVHELGVESCHFLLEVGDALGGEGVSVGLLDEGRELHNLNLNIKLI